MDLDLALTRTRSRHFSGLTFDKIAGPLPVNIIELARQGRAPLPVLL